MTAHQAVIEAVTQVGCLPGPDLYDEGWNDALSAVLDASNRGRPGAGIQPDDNGQAAATPRKPSASPAAARVFSRGGPARREHGAST